MRLRNTLIALISAAALVLAVSGGFLWGHSQHSGGPNAVDIGFARDMSTHHDQAVRMAYYAFEDTTDAGVKAIANDVYYTQLSQLGTMQGWLQQWGVSAVSTSPMAWMGHEHIAENGLMPGMATAPQLSALKVARGKKLDILFLQLMVRHHQGALEMAQYATDNAATGYVRQLAGKMYVNQADEIVQMEGLLRQLGGTPLTPPD